MPAVGPILCATANGGDAPAYTRPARHRVRDNLPMTARTDISISSLLTQLGIVGAEEVAAARSALEAEGLTNPRKTNIALTKRDAVERVIDARFLRLCVHCAQNVAEASDPNAKATAEPTAAGLDLPVMRVAQSNCTRCGGSNNQRAIDEMLAACADAGVRRIVLVGGSPSLRQEFQQFVSEALELRLVDGTRRASRASADADIVWADIVIVLGTSQLAHKVSQLYTDDPAARKKAITVRRRGIEAIATAITGSDRVRGARA